MSIQKLAVHTDIIAEHLTHDGSVPSTLRMVMSKFFCYTTVFNAIELFSIARNEQERRSVEHAMNAMKILGLNAKSAVKFGEWAAKSKNVSMLHLLAAGVCLESRLPLLTSRPPDVRGVKGLRIVHASKVTATASAAEILSHAIVC